MTKALQALLADGVEIDEAAMACLSPYQTEHINRFGRYTLKRDRRSSGSGMRVRVLRRPRTRLSTRNERNDFFYATKGTNRFVRRQ